MHFKSVLLLAVVALSFVLAVVSAGPNKKHNSNGQRPKRSYGRYYGDDDDFDMARHKYSYGDDVDGVPMARHKWNSYGDDVDMAAQHYGYNRYGYGDDDTDKQVAGSSAEMDRQQRKKG